MVFSYAAWTEKNAILLEENSDFCYNHKMVECVY